MQSRQDDGCLSCGLRPWRVIVVPCLLPVGPEMIGLDALRALQPSFYTLTQTEPHTHKLLDCFCLYAL